MSTESGNPKVERKHATIMFTDIVGYTALMGSDEDKAFEILRKNRAIHQELSGKHDGKLVKELGDGMLLSFNLPSDAVRCAIDIQLACKAENIPLKIGIHDGEVTFEGKDVFGDGVNISSRLQADARKGNIYVSGSVYRNVKNKKNIRSRFIDEKTYKNVDDPIRVYQIISSDDELLEIPVRSNKGKSFRTAYLIASIAGATVLILAGILIWQFNPFSKSFRERSIAVMPFTNASADSSNIYLANGMMEEIRNSLAKIRDLRVVSKTSTEKYRGTLTSLAEIADQLRVNYLVEGSIQRQDEVIKIHAQLTDIENDHVLWAETFNRDIGNAFAIQSEIAQTIAHQLEAAITPEEKKIIETVPTQNKEAYDLYLRGKEFFNRGGESNVNMAIDFYHRAIALDPEFALAYVWLGMAYFVQTRSMNYFNEDFADTMKFYANKAMAIDPDLSDGYWLRAEYYRLRSKNDSSIVDATRALQLNPNNERAYFVLGMNYYYKRDIANALINLRKARELGIGDMDFYPMVLEKTVAVYHSIGDLGKAKAFSEEMIGYKPDQAYFNLWGIECFIGEIDHSKIYIDSLCAIDSGFLCKASLMFNYIFTGEFERFLEPGLGTELFSYASEIWKSYILFNLNKTEEAEAYYRQGAEYLNRSIELERIDATGGLDYYDLAAQYAYIGEREKAYQILHKMEEEKILECWAVWWMPFDPRFESMREEAELRDIINRQEKRYAEIRAQIDEMEAAGVF